MQGRVWLFLSSFLLAVVAMAISCSSDPPSSGDMTTGGTPPGETRDASADGVTGPDGSSITDASIDTTAPTDTAVDSRRPIDAATDAGRPNDVSLDAGSADANRVDVAVDSTTPPVSDSGPPSDAGGGAIDATPDVGGPGDAGCDPTLTGVDLFRCQALTFGRAYEFLDELSTTVGPRLAGTAGFTNAVTWAKNKMMALGLQNVRTEAVTVPHWERGAGHAELLGTTERSLSIAALGGSVATDPAGLEAEVIEVTSSSALSSLSSSQAQGKIIFVNVVTQRAKDASGYSANVSLRRNGPSTAASKGAAGYILRSITPALNASPHTGDMQSIPQIPAVAIGTSDADVLSAAIKAGTTRVRITLGCQTLASVQAANVIGEFVGKQAPDEILVLSGHLDSWDLATGSVDDGAGVAMAVEAARLISVYAPDTRRTIRVVAFANEENGLSGANAYATAHSSELAKHVMAIEGDLGADRVYAATFQAGSSATTTIRDLLAPLAPLGVSTATSGGDYGSDLGPIRSRGVPVAELPQDLTRYFDFHHSPDDTMAAVDRDALTQATAAMAVFAYQLGRSSADFGRASLPVTAPAQAH